MVDDLQAALDGGASWPAPPTDEVSEEDLAELQAFMVGQMPSPAAAPLRRVAFASEPENLYFDPSAIISESRLEWQEGLVYEVPLPKVGPKMPHKHVPEELADRLYADILNREFLRLPGVPGGPFSCEAEVQEAVGYVQDYAKAQERFLRMASSEIWRASGCDQEDKKAIEKAAEEHLALYRYQVADLCNGLWHVGDLPPSPEDGPPSPSASVPFRLAPVGSRGMAGCSAKPPRPHGSRGHAGGARHAAMTGLTRDKQGRFKTT